MQYPWHVISNAEHTVVCATRSSQSNHPYFMLKKINDNSTMAVYVDSVALPHLRDFRSSIDITKISTLDMCWQSLSMSVFSVNKKCSKNLPHTKFYQRIDPQSLTVLKSRWCKKSWGHKKLGKDWGVFGKEAKNCVSI